MSELNTNSERFFFPIGFGLNDRNNFANPFSFILKLCYLKFTY